MQFWLNIFFNDHKVIPSLSPFLSLRLIEILTWAWQSQLGFLSLIADGCNFIIIELLNGNSKWRRFRVKDSNINILMSSLSICFTFIYFPLLWCDLNHSENVLFEFLEKYILTDKSTLSGNVKDGSQPYTSSEYLFQWDHGIRSVVPYIWWPVEIEFKWIIIPCISSQGYTWD